MESEIMAYLIVTAFFDGLLLIILARLFFKSGNDMFEAFLFSRAPVTASYFSKKGGKLFFGMLKLLLLVIIFSLVIFAEYKLLK